MASFAWAKLVRLQKLPQFKKVTFLFMKSIDFAFVFIYFSRNLYRFINTKANTLTRVTMVNYWLIENLIDFNPFKSPLTIQRYKV